MGEKPSRGSTPARPIPAPPKQPRVASPGLTGKVILNKKRTRRAAVVAGRFLPRRGRLTLRPGEPPNVLIPRAATGALARARTAIHFRRAHSPSDGAQGGRPPLGAHAPDPSICKRRRPRHARGRGRRPRRGWVRTGAHAASVRPGSPAPRARRRDQFGFAAACSLVAIKRLAGHTAAPGRPSRKSAVYAALRTP